MLDTLLPMLLRLDESGILFPLGLLFALYAAGHALLSRRDPRTAWGWIAVCWLFPFAGPALYFIFGINRLQTRAQRLGLESRRPGEHGVLHPDDVRHHPHTAGAHIPPWLDEVTRTADTLTRLPLLGGNRIEPLHNGDQAYPRMLAAIEQARHSVALATYIFDNDAIGQRFVDALDRARARGVDVRVMIDGFGQHYSLVPITRVLRARGIDCAMFNPLRLLPPSLHVNLRNHRKLLLVDGTVGFSGGMNIGRRHVLGDGGAPNPAVDLHFEIRGPVLDQLAQAFADDWRLCGKPEWQRPPRATAVDDPGAICRVIIDGPNEDFDHLALIMQSAISAARREVQIMTPYFLPPNEMISELQGAALRGVDVQVILPEKSNLPFVDWATRNMLGELLRFGVRICYQPPPFCHSKLLVVDGAYALIGSANLDARSLKLNFELGVEIYDRSLAQTLAAHCSAVRARAREIHLAEINGRSLPARLRDALFWLFSPYL
ncbi:cardiolipin synthetase 2 [Fontimonas thermophila]|uniref:Cardiolipin synthetase 2 n=1 Tax=Fontimonas thermophila TaxID=1076937 RepID=A0A1I2JUJ9_9GAMM|nr:phospholipase D-like domain-containing protein [Fontimonas thermophila]SFF58224.1 cardiolipin synthetase 2 [Fontimonas thermophila]